MKYFSCAIWTFAMVLLCSTSLEAQPDLKERLESKNYNFPEAGSDGTFQDHPWENGRNPAESLRDWIQESDYAVGSLPGGIPGPPNPSDFDRFMRCLEPRLVRPFCRFCAPIRFRPEAYGPFSCPNEWNSGFVVAYWWPEATVEVNDFGISAWNPIAHDSGAAARGLNKNVLQELIRRGLLYGLGSSDDATTGGLTNYFLGLGIQPDDDVVDEADDDTGQSAFEGFLPGDQNLVQEAHVYQTNVGLATSRRRDPLKGKFDFRYKKTKVGCIPKPFWYNGYKKGNRECFYNTLRPEVDATHMWTEELEFAPYWRIPELSKDLDEDLYEKAVPKEVSGTPKPGQSLLSYRLSDFRYWDTRSCAAYRAGRWPEVVAGYTYDEDGNSSPVKYKQLTELLGVQENAFQGGERICYRGGGNLMPISGTLAGHFNPLVSAAYLSRRALFLSSRKGDNKTFYFSDPSDKFQRVHPSKSECFGINDVMQTNKGLFPDDAVSPGDKGSIRYTYWNMRMGCVCQYRGTYPKVLFYLPAGAGIFIKKFGEGCHPWSYSAESQGNAEVQQRKGYESPLPRPPLTWPIFPFLPDKRFVQSIEQLYPFERIRTIQGGS